MREPVRNEKEEKDVAKHEEKGFEEKWQRDPISALSWALILIWVGVVLLLYNLDLISSLVDFVEGLNLPLAELPFDIPFFYPEAWQIHQ